jgi:magnesium transporter
MFIGRNYVVTVHYDFLPVLDEVRDRWHSAAHNVGQHPSAMLVYSILDAIVDDYFPFIDDLADRIDDLEEKVLNQADQATLHELFRFRKDLIAIRRVLAPERDVLNVLVRRETPVFDRETVIYFQDVYDHILRVTDAIDTYRDLISSALDAYLSAASNRLNQVMKTLTAASIILMTVTLVASIYGMNFVHMPELQWRFGYLWALGLMVILALVILEIFRRRDYF